MKKILFFLLIFFSLIKPVMAGYVNWLQEDTLESYSGIFEGEQAKGNASYVGDNDLSTRFATGSSCPNGWCPVVYGSVEVTVSFSKSNIKVDKIEFTIETKADVSGYQSHSYDVQIYDGRWHSVSSYNGDGQIGYQTFTANFPEYSNVSKIKIVVIGSGATEWMGGSAEASIYEIKAWGNNNVDIGLRAYDGNSIIKIACEELNGKPSSVLRIKKGDKSYAVALVETTDANASKIRIKTNSGIKALAKIN